MSSSEKSRTYLLSHFADLHGCPAGSRSQAHKVAPGSASNPTRGHDGDHGDPVTTDPQWDEDGRLHFVSDRRGRHEIFRTEEPWRAGQACSGRADIAAAMAATMRFQSWVSVRKRPRPSVVSR